jgi:hypothetical protein
MSEPKPVYRTKADATPAAARMALSYRKTLQDLRDTMQACDEIAEDRDNAILEIERLTKEIKKLHAQREKLQGQP